MAKVYLGIGSNLKRREHISAALDWVAENYCSEEPGSKNSDFDNRSIERSPVYETEPVGVQCERFYNLVVAIHTEQPVGELFAALRELEHSLGRRRDGAVACHSLDIDILLYGDCVGFVDGVQLPREEILHNAYVLRPLADLAPDLKHPVVNKTYGQLWQEYDRPQELWPVELT